jgi:hypothetical protein
MVDETTGAAVRVAGGSCANGFRRATLRPLREFLEIDLRKEGASRFVALGDGRLGLYAATGRTIDPGTGVSVMVHLPGHTFAAPGVIELVRFGVGRLSPGLIVRLGAVEAPSARLIRRFLSRRPAVPC